METITAKFSVENYHKMIDAGLLNYRNVELINGLILEMSPEGTEHTYIGETLADYFRRLTQGMAWVREARPITLSQSEPEPDIAIVRLPHSLYRSHHPYPEDIYLLIEISNSTLKFDTSEKRDIYAAANIQDYWVVDVKNQKLIVYRTPVNGLYENKTILSLEEQVSPLAFPDINSIVNDIFNR
ncbi:MAG: Uma2 family endonuclease [Crocosphaera sp.]